VAKEDIKTGDIAKLIGVLLPFFVIMGSFYNNGQGSVFGDVYFSSIGYQDTLLQLFVPLRTMVLLTTIVFVLVLAGCIALFVFSTLRTVKTILGYRLMQRKARKRFAKNEIGRLKNEETALTLATVLAQESDTPAHVLASVASDYSAIKKYRAADQRGVDMYDDFVFDMKRFLKKREPEPEGKSVVATRSVFGKWFDKKNKLIVQTVILSGFLLACLMAVLVNYWITDTVYLSFLILSLIFFLYILLNLITWFWGVSSEKPIGPMDQFIGLVIVFCVSSIFMFALGRDEAQSAVLNSDTYQVFSKDAQFEGRLIASNHSGVLLLEESEFLYIRWSSIQHIELKSGEP